MCRDIIKVEERTPKIWSAVGVREGVFLLGCPMAKGSSSSSSSGSGIAGLDGALLGTLCGLESSEVPRMLKGSSCTWG